MQRWGKTAAGTIRWRCPECSISRVVNRPDVTKRSLYILFSSWITGTKTLTDIASIYSVNRRTITVWLKPFWNYSPQPLPPPTKIDTLVIDGIYLKSRIHCALIGRTTLTVIFWMFCERESYGSWLIFFSHVPEPKVVVCDGQRGMKSALKTAWPHSRVQRCLFHIHELSMSRITQNPRTKYGNDLKIIVKQIFDVRTRRQKRRWIRLYKKWRRKSETFLKEKTQIQIPGRKRSWWYTHKKLRSVRSLIDNALSEMFTYIGHSEIPRTSNHVEGGLNSQISELIHRHRGISEQKKEVLVSHFLAKKQRQKPTRNIT